VDHSDHVNLLRDGIPEPGGLWADLGAGTGAFTLALAELIGPGGQIYAVDKDRGALRRLERSVSARFPQTTVHCCSADFTQSLDLPPLDGVVMANVLHFQRHAVRKAVVQLIRGYLRPGGRLILVEYDTDRGNRWVPYPLSYQTWQKLAAEAGLSSTNLLATRPSRFLGQIYSALSLG
jgi:SAM-dependent methyltransferase